MRLSDIMSHAGLALYAEVAMVIFLIVFLAVLYRTFRPSKRQEYEDMGRLPFEDGSKDPQPPGGER